MEIDYENTVAFILGMLLMMIVFFIIAPGNALSQESLDEICIHITSNSAAVGEVTNVNLRSRGDLKCILPSYDHTQRIIITKNNDAELGAK